MNKDKKTRELNTKIFLCKKLIKDLIKWRRDNMYKKEVLHVLNTKIILYERLVKEISLS